MLRFIESAITFFCFSLGFGFGFSFGLWWTIVGLLVYNNVVGNSVGVKALIVGVPAEGWGVGTSAVGWGVGTVDVNDVDDDTRDHNQELSVLTTTAL